MALLPESVSPNVLVSHIARRTMSYTTSAIPFDIHLDVYDMESTMVCSESQPVAQDVGSTTVEPVFRRNLLSLAAEIRLTIYPYLLLPDGQWRPSRRHSLEYKSTDGSETIHPQIMRTCKTCYSESIGVLHSECNFSIHTKTDLIGFNHNFILKIVRSNACRIKSIDCSTIFGQAQQQAVRGHQNSKINLCSSLDSTTRRDAENLPKCHTC
jgi:hypothetical protein